ncbi:MAG: hypothetical protein ACRDT1_12460 [Micromonosporaceae bacterium]
MFAINFEDFWKVLEVWSAGRPTSNVTLWGLPMVWWGRIGKLMQFAAGCVVVLDLIGPDRLREVGERATDRWKASVTGLREQAELGRLHQRIEGLFICAAGNPAIHRSWALMSNASASLPNQPWFTAEMVDELEVKIWAGVRQLHTGHHDPDATSHDCARRAQPHHFVCGPEAMWAEQQVKAFVWDGLPARERDLLRQWERGLFRRNYWYFAGAVAGYVLFLSWVVWTAPAWGSNPPWHAVLLTLLAFFAILTPILLPAHSERRATLVSSFTGAVATVLDQARPGHQVRWLGFCLFVLGFSLDLLAS